MKCQKQAFLLPDGVTYLNCAYMSPLLKAVQQAGIEGINRKSNPAELDASDFFEPVEEVRKAFSKLIDCQEYRRIAVVPSVSYGLANVANNIKFERDDEILIVGQQFPSNYYIWKQQADYSGAKITIVSRKKSIPFSAESWNTEILKSINNRTKLVTMPIHHWADGTKFLIREIREKASKYGALLVLDGTQTIGAFPFSVREIRPDALICAGYKFLLGPYSIGLAFYGTAFDHGVPIEESWMNRTDSHIFSKLVNYQAGHRPYARRYEVGESSNFILIPMLLKALQQLNEWKPECIQEYCCKISRSPLARLAGKGFKIETESWRGSHLFGIRLPHSSDPEFIRQKLTERKIFVSIRGDSVRVSPHLYNIEDDIDYLADELLHLVDQ